MPKEKKIINSRITLEYDLDEDSYNFSLTIGDTTHDINWHDVWQLGDEMRKFHRKLENNKKTKWQEQRTARLAEAMKDPDPYGDKWTFCVFCERADTAWYVCNDKRGATMCESGSCPGPTINVKHNP